MKSRSFIVAQSLQGLLALQALVFFFSSVSADEFSFCVAGDRGSERVRVITHQGESKEEMRAIAQREGCEDTCSVFCVASDASEQICGNTDGRVYDTFQANRHTFCEYSDHTPYSDAEVEINLTSTFSPDINHIEEKNSSIVGAANNFLKKSNCPLVISSRYPVAILPQSYVGVSISGKSELDSLLRYPGDIKFIPTIHFCGEKLSTMSLDHLGDDVIEECSSRDFASMIVSDSSAPVQAIMMLRGIWHLAGEKESTGDVDRYTPSDPVLMIPESPLLSENYDAFHITPGQCLKMIIYARQRT
ncbi:hypothetical protein [Rhizobium ruizarguesonis]|uniref:hypothetical protein n=1 Tax=Rhizobium ruizarguesonis TaxID=2081791 RepID=UPI00102FA38E|nr:hypothetical protein [Rhizobium ruizarguesonis]TAV00318.1 hypothetical protein ELI39_30935 [Rhizobium ruizarguesonis]